MRKVFLSVLTTALICAAFAVPAFADYGYTETSDIPMARDFTVEVVFDEEGEPHVLTDYPYRETGANEMNLVYGLDDDHPEVVSLQYYFATGKTSVHGYGHTDYDYTDLKKAVEAVRNGTVTLEDSITINTNRNNDQVDWLLTYSLSQGRYTSYTERTHSQGFNGMGNGGFSRSIYYEGGEMTGTRVMKRISKADLIIERNRTGQINYASVYQYSPTRAYYDYDSATGLFGGHELSELGFQNSDIEINPLAMIGQQTQSGVVVASEQGEAELITSVAQPESVPIVVTRGNAATTIVGGLLSGILIGLTLFRLFRRRKEEPKPAPAEETAVPEEIPESQARNMNG